MDLKRLGNFLGRFFCAISPGKLIPDLELVTSFFMVVIQ